MTKKNLKQKKENPKKIQNPVLEQNNGFERTQFPEIFIGLVGPLGVDLNSVCEELSRTLQEVGYLPEVIRLTDILREPSIQKIHGVTLEDTPEDARIRSYMNAGNKLRERIIAKDAMALFSILQIRERRFKETGNKNKFIPRKAYILRSFKNKEEIETLKNVYGPAFFTISVYSPREKRKDNLAKRIENSRGKSTSHDGNAIAEKLIDDDYSEEQTNYGQDIKSAFPLADLFVAVEETQTNLEKSLKRFVHTLFGYPYHTPNKNEFGMFLAFSVAMRSADLSRQVGAAILDKEGDLLSIGCNEVPKYGGGQYWEDDEGNKARDFEMGFDSSAKMKREMIEETIKIMQAEGLIDKTKTPMQLANDMLAKNSKSQIKDAHIANLLEFGRIVHAEMAAITDASKRGISLKGATLYCTTFPCHMCARHIVSAGIEKVVYVEPYPKSKAQDLYQDSIVVDPPNEMINKVTFRPFIGISPYRFHDFFRHGKRKDDDGKRIFWATNQATPRIKIYNSMSYIVHEEDVVVLVEKLIHGKN